MKTYSFITSVLIYLFCITNLLNAQTPGISSFSPSTGSVGTLVTITGVNLGSPKAFSIGGVTAIVVSNTGTTLVGLVMPGATTGAISVTTAKGTATSASNFTLLPTPYPISQQGKKLVGSGGVNSNEGVWQGWSAAISADGNTAIVGGDWDNSSIGAAWVYTRSTGIWTQQGGKLIGTGAVNSLYPAAQGFSVAISADGNNAIVGGIDDDSGKGAAWVYIRSAGTWIQQGNKLVGTGAVNSPNGAHQGYSVSVSADGNTAVIGGYHDDNEVGAAWVFTRSSGVWTQQGSKLVGSGSSGQSNQGQSVAISADGNSIAVGGPSDNNGLGAAWVYTRSGGTWIQQGNKLTATGGTGSVALGFSVSISADGNTVIIGGPNDSGSTGAAWVFTRSAGTWTQQGGKLTGTGFVSGISGSYEGGSVSVSADGNTAIIGANNDNNGIGAAWVFTCSGGIWTQQGNKLIGTGAIGPADQGESVAVSADASTAIVGGPIDSAVGAAWIYTSTVTGIENILNQNSFIIYPNPNNGKFTIDPDNYRDGQLTMNNEKTSIDVYNVMGGKVYSQMSIFHYPLTIDISNQPNGVYLYRLQTKDGSLVSSGKLVIQK